MEHGPIHSKPVRYRSWPWSFNRKRTSTISKSRSVVSCKKYFPASPVIGLPVHLGCFCLPMVAPIASSRGTRRFSSSPTLAHSGALLKLRGAPIVCGTLYTDRNPLFRCIHCLSSVIASLWRLAETPYSCTKRTAPTADIECPQAER